MGLRPDYATTVYCNLIRRSYQHIPIIVGGIEASLRRLAHYDYWSDKLKRSLLLDSQADLLLYTCRGEPNDYHSVAAPVLLLDLLIMKTSQALGGGLEKAKKLQKLREAYGGLIRR